MITENLFIRDQSRTINRKPVQSKHLASVHCAAYSAVESSRILWFFIADTSNLQRIDSFVNSIVDSIVNLVTSSIVGLIVDPSDDSIAN